MRRPWLSAAGTLLLAAAACSTQAGGHDDARELREAGEILPLQQILLRLDPPEQRVLEVELERKGDRYIYEIETLDEGGQVWELDYDARSGELLERKRER